MEVICRDDQLDHYITLMTIMTRIFLVQGMKGGRGVRGSNKGCEELIKSLVTVRFVNVEHERSNLSSFK